MYTHTRTQSFQAVRRVPSVAAHSIRELVSPRNTDTLSLVDETLEFEVCACASVLWAWVLVHTRLLFQAENKSVTNSEDGDNQFDGDFEVCVTSTSWMFYKWVIYTRCRQMAKTAMSKVAI